MTFADVTVVQQFCILLQAEDGIRDVAVTGVQTCALPISNLLYRGHGDGKFEEVAARAGLKPVYETVAAAFADFNNDGYLDLYLVNGGNLFRKSPRSGERRVGKESRYWRSPYPLKTIIWER